jgi:hypothetical protein
MMPPSPMHWQSGMPTPHSGDRPATIRRLNPKVPVLLKIPARSQGQNNKNQTLETGLPIHVDAPVPFRPSQNSVCGPREHMIIFSEVTRVRQRPGKCFLMNETQNGICHLPDKLAVLSAFLFNISLKFFAQMPLRYGNGPRSAGAIFFDSFLRTLNFRPLHLISSLPTRRANLCRHLPNQIQFRGAGNDAHGKLWRQPIISRRNSAHRQCPPTYKRSFFQNQPG